MYKEFLVNFSKGLRKNGSPRIYNDGECSIAQDCYFDEVGNIYSRKFINTKFNYNSKVLSIINYNNRLVNILNNGDMYVNENLVAKEMFGGRFSNVIYNDICYLTNRINAKRFDGQHLENIGIIAPTVRPTVSVDRAFLSDCATAWTASANVTAETDEHTYKENPDDEDDVTSNKLTIDGAFGTGLIAYENMSATDFSSYDYVNFWIKSDTNLKGGVLQLLIDNNNACASPTETLDIPALTADTWRLVSLELKTPGDLTGIKSVGLNADSDPGAIEVHIDNIRCIKRSNLNGTYYYRYTYVDRYGNESSPSPISVSVSSEKETVDIVMTDSNEDKVQYFNLYRLGGTLSDWYFVKQVDIGSFESVAPSLPIIPIVVIEETTNTTATTDITRDSNLSTLFDADSNDPCPDGLNYVIEHYERIIGAKTTLYPHSIQYSVEYQPEYWGSSLDQQFLISNKDECTGLLSWGKYIIFCKEDKIFVMEGSVPSNWHKRKSDSNFGNIAPWALCFYKVPIFLTYSGLYFFNGNNEEEFSFIIRDYFKNKNLEQAISCIYDNKLYLIIDRDLLIYDFLLKIFYTYNIELSELNHIKNVLYAGYGNDLVMLEQDENLTNETINFKIKSKAYALSEIPNDEGKIKCFDLCINTRSQDATVNIYIDKVLKQSKTVNTFNMSRERITTDAKINGRFVEFEIEYSGTGKIDIEPPIVVNPSV